MIKSASLRKSDMSEQIGTSSPARTPARPTIGQVLMNAELIDKDDLQLALKLQTSGDDRRLGTILIEEGILTAESLAMALSVHLNLPFIDLKRHRVQAEALEAVPEETARRHHLIPLDFVDGSLAVVMEDPTDIQVIEELEALAGRSIRPMVGVSNEIKAAIDLSYKSRDAIEKEVAEFAPRLPVGIDMPSADEEEAGAQDPVVRAVDLILEQAVRERASDIHIVPDHEVVRVRYRIDGVLQDSLSLPTGSHYPLLSRVKILADMNIAERRRPQDGQFSKVMAGEETFFRVSTSDTTWGEMATLRVLGRIDKLLGLDGLGLTSENIARLKGIVNAPFGMLLVSGPTGSGKTTTLYAALNQLDRDHRNVMTIEDPVEYNFPRINQIQVNRAADITFASGLRGVMRLDPDVVMVGEVRDGETAQAATQAALTGHLVLSSIHANDAPGVLFRLDHLGVQRYLLASAVAGVVSQRLVRRVCTHCRAAVRPSDAERSAYQRIMGEALDQAYRGQGCNHCGHSGYLGRTGVFEVMIANEQIRQMFLEGASAGQIKDVAIEHGMKTMLQDGMLKVKQGITTIVEVSRVAASQR